MYTGNSLEGDSNLSESRKKWQSAQQHEPTKHALAEDASVFLHQALSTPCLDVLEACEGIYLTENKQIIGLRRFITLIKGNFVPGADPVYVSDNFLMPIWRQE